MYRSPSHRHLGSVRHPEGTNITGKILDIVHAPGRLGPLALPVVAGDVEAEEAEDEVGELARAEAEPQARDQSRSADLHVEGVEEPARFPRVVSGPE